MKLVRCHAVPVMHFPCMGAVLWLLLGLSCTVHQPMNHEPTSPLPESFSRTGQLEVPDAWWFSLGGEKLDALIREALNQNPTVGMAWARLRQARAVARQSGSGRYPGINVAAGAERQRVSEDVLLQQPFLTDRTTDTFSASVSLSYQVDLWKRIANAHRADALNAAATRKDAESTALLVSSAVSELWMTLLTQGESLGLLEQQLKASEDYLTLMESRFARGLASAMDVYRQRLQVETTRQQIPGVKTAMATASHQLAIMLGRAPQSVLSVEKSTLPNLPALPVIPVPLEWLRQRPDISAAEYRLAAADHRVAVAIAERFPSLSLSLTAGSQASEVSNLLDMWFTSLAANLLGPIFDAGRRKAEVARNRAVLEERYHAWRNAMLNGLAEVEDALTREEQLARSEEILATQLDLAEKTLTQSRSRYLNGLTDYLNVLTSLQSLHALQRSELQIRNDRLANRIQLHAALGGRWFENLEEPQPQYSQARKRS